MSPSPACVPSPPPYIAEEEKNAIFTYSLHLLGRGHGLWKKHCLLLDKGHYVTNSACLDALSMLEQGSKGRDSCHIMRMMMGGGEFL